MPLAELADLGHIPPWERTEEGEMPLRQTRRLPLGTIEVVAVRGGWSWWVDVPRFKVRAQGFEERQANARYRAMLVYLAVTREVKP
jgi:hypothetical protein